MALPKLAAPTFELTIPTTNKKIEYRPFLVKEEKILLTARESGEQIDIFRAIKQIINNCVITEDFDIDQIPLIDMEYIFIQLRAKSIDNIVKFQIQDQEDEKSYEIQVNLDEVEIQYPEEKHDGIINIDDTYGVKMKYPSASISDVLSSMDTAEEIIEKMVMNCIEYVFDKEDTYQWDGEKESDKKEFLGSLPVEAYTKMQEFFETTPYIEHVVTYKNSNDEEKKVTFRTLSDFFILD